MIFLFSNFVNIHTKFNNKEPVYNRLSSCGRNQLEVNQVVREIVTALDPIDEFLHHLDGAHVGIGSKGEVDDSLDRNAIIHDISSIRSMLAIIICFHECFYNPSHLEIPFPGATLSELLIESVDSTHDRAECFTRDSDSEVIEIQPTCETMI